MVQSPLIKKIEKEKENSASRSMDFFDIDMFQHEPPVHNFKTPLEGIDPVHEMTGLHNFNIAGSDCM